MLIERLLSSTNSKIYYNVYGDIVVAFIALFDLLLFIVLLCIYYLHTVFISSA